MATVSEEYMPKWANKFMKLPRIKLPAKTTDKNYFLALILRNEKVTAVIFENINNSIKYINQAEEYFSNTIEDADTEHFLDTLDKAITGAESVLPESIETHKTLLGLKASWVEDNKIKKEYLEKLKKASDELSLNPIGFLIFAESVINLIQKEEGAPVTAILAELGKKYISVSLVKTGKILETKTSEIHESPTFTVDTLLKHFQTPEVMPARIILLDSEEEDLTQDFIGHTWSKSLPFLHIPQIVSLPQDSAIKSMLLGAATQMGATLSYDSPISLDDEPEKLEPEEPITPPNDEALESAPEVEKDLEEKHKLDYVGKDESAEFFGFAENTDVSKNPVPEIKNQAGVPPEVLEERIDEIPEGVKTEEETREKEGGNASLVTSKIKNVLPIVISSFKRIKIDKVFLQKNRKLLIIAGAILIILIIALFFFLTASSATVTILVDPKVEDKTTSVTFSSLTPTDIDSLVIASDFVSVSEEGSISGPATGKKDVGNSAKGTVTIFNNSSDSVSFPSGTTINSSNNLEFTLDKSVTVASSSGDIFSGTTPGTSDVSVTAAEIGTDYNLPSGTKFSIGSNSDVAAKNDNAFSGGTKKQVTVVSKEDQAKLLAKLPKNLESKALNNIKGKAPSGETILQNFVDETVTDQNFDKKVDAEASSFTLKGTVSFKAAAYKNSDILELANSLFTSGDAVLSKENLEVSAKNIEVSKNNDVNADLDIKAKTLPKIDNVSLSKEIQGQNLQKAKNLILNISQVKNVTIAIHPNIPFLSGNLPGDYKKITIIVKSN